MFKKCLKFFGLVNSYNDSIFKRRYWKFKYQKLTRGFHDGETYSLDYSLAKLILPRLKVFKGFAVEHGIPGKIDSMFKEGYELNNFGAIKNKKARKRQWQKAKEYWGTQIQYMIDAFEMIIAEGEDDEFFDKLEKATAQFNKKISKIKDPNKKREVLKKFKKPYGRPENKDVVLGFEYQSYIIERGLKAFQEYYCSLWW